MTKFRANCQVVNRNVTNLHKRYIGGFGTYIVIYYSLYTAKLYKVFGRCHLENRILNLCVLWTRSSVCRY